MSWYYRRADELGRWIASASGGIIRFLKMEHPVISQGTLPIFGMLAAKSGIARSNVIARLGLFCSHQQRGLEPWRSEVEESAQLQRQLPLRCIDKADRPGRWLELGQHWLQLAASAG